MQVLAEPLLADVHQVFAREGREAAGLGIGAGENDAQQLGPLLARELGRTAIAPAIAEPVQAVRVVADHPVAQRLAVHARAFGSRIRLMPSSALAMASMRRPMRASGSARASLRSTAAVRSRRIESARICPPSKSTMQGNHTHEARNRSRQREFRRFGRRV